MLQIGYNLISCVDSRRYFRQKTADLRCREWRKRAIVPMPQIAAYLGHVDSRVTEPVYAGHQPDVLRRAAVALA